MRPLVLALLLLLPAAHGVAAQDDVDRVAGAVAQAWSDGDAQALEGHLPEAGIHLDLDGSDDRGLGRRQARAALDRFLSGYDRAPASILRAEGLGGSPARALVELSWTTRASGTPETRSFVIFLSLERSDADWHIREIRVFS